MKFKLITLTFIVLTLSLFSPLLEQAALSSPYRQGADFSAIYTLSINRSALPAPAAPQGAAAAAATPVARVPARRLVQQPLARIDSPDYELLRAASEDRRLTDFIQSVRDSARPESIVGAYASHVLAAPVVQQPASDPIYVSSQEHHLTQFRRASQAGSIGLLAHNYLAGRFFFNLDTGSKITLVYGDGSYQHYRVYDILDYQALTLYSYKDLETQAVIDQYRLFDKIYSGQNDKLVLQTCIEKDGAFSWGRRFILAEMISGRLTNDDGTLGAAGVSGDNLPVFGQ